MTLSKDFKNRLLDENKGIKSDLLDRNYSRSLLVAEDNSINRRILVKILADDYNVFEASNGKEALDLLEEHSDEIGLILLDINMPVMDGYTFLDIIRDKIEYANIPIVVVTSSNTEDDEVNALRKGANDFISKPYRPLVIKKRVDNLISFRESLYMINAMKYDRLTGANNKDYFYKKAEQIINDNPNIDYDIICSDIENFSAINDMYGYEIGNGLLGEIADLCHKYVKDKGIFARINGDVFAMLMPRTKEYSEEFFKKFELELNSRFKRSKIRVDFGIYPLTKSNVHFSVACDKAILASDSIKGVFGKNFAIYNDSMVKDKMHALHVSDRMEEALNNKEFKVYFQPKFSLEENQRIVGAEALVRWISYNEGVIGPDKFIPIFEKNGFITMIDYFVFREACRFLRECKDNKLKVVPISVNISKVDLYDNLLIDTLLSYLNEFSIDISLVHIEITETTYADNDGIIIERINKLSECGFILEMDDFGKGLSSLNMLNELPIDILKLDMKFAQKDLTDYKQKGIIELILNLTDLLGIYVIAEGVETNQQKSILKSLRCNAAQGYYFAKPMNEVDYINFLKKQ